jgi:hypothetical protein
MCGPLAALGLMAGGSLAKYFGERQAQHAQNRAFQAEQHRQSAMTEQQQAAESDSLAKTATLADPNAEADAANTRKAAFISALNQRSPTQDYLPGGQGAPSAVADTTNRVVEAQHADSERHAGALASLAGFGDQVFKSSIGVNRNAQTIGQIGRDKQGSAAVLPAELQAAAQKGGFLRGLGDLAMTAASFAGGMGGGGAGAGSAGAMQAARAIPSFAPELAGAPQFLARWTG